MTEDISLSYTLDCALFQRSVTDAANELKQLGLVGYVSCKEVRRLICKIKRSRRPILCRTPAERVVIETVKKFMGVMNPNKIARIIRRNFARAAARHMLPLVAIKLDCSDLRNVDGKDLDLCFSGQG